MTSAPWRAPAIDGANVTLSVQLALAISVKPLLQGVAPLPTAVKFPLVAIVEMVTARVVLVFCTVTVFGELVVAIAWLLKANDAGVNFSGEVLLPVPLPVSFTSTGL
jgi:hypothetical protein